MTEFTKINITRKSYQELTGIKNIYTSTCILCTNETSSRWTLYKDTVAFIDRCLMKEGSAGSLVCVTTDASKARNHIKSSTCSVNYILAKEHELNNEENIKLALDCIIDKYPDTQVILFENIGAKDIHLSASALVRYVRKYLPCSVTSVFTVGTPVSTRCSIDRTILKEEITLSTKVYATEVYTETAPSMMSYFNFIFKP